MSLPRSLRPTPFGAKVCGCASLLERVHVGDVEYVRVSETLHCCKHASRLTTQPQTLLITGSPSSTRSSQSQGGSSHDGEDAPSLPQETPPRRKSSVQARRKSPTTFEEFSLTPVQRASTSQSLGFQHATHSVRAALVSSCSSFAPHSLLLSLPAHQTRETEQEKEYRRLLKRSRERQAKLEELRLAELQARTERETAERDARIQEENQVRWT